MEDPTIPKSLHPALLQLNGGPVLAQIAAGEQEQIANFFDSDGLDIIHPEPARYFEVPIVLQLPEILSFIR